MSKLEELERAVQELSLHEREQFRAWFVEFDAEEWNRQFTDDVAAGRLDWLRTEALADREAGRCTDR